MPDRQQDLLARDGAGHQPVQLVLRPPLAEECLLKTFPICRWSGQLGPKTRAGDRQAPEGFYQATSARLNPNSDYYLSFNLGYPNQLEKALGYTGSAMMVHGACSSAGCYALTDRGMAEIYPVIREALAGGQDSIQVQSFPFKMSVSNMLRHRGNPNFEFWQNLKIGYDSFETSRIPPKFGSCGGHYVFGPATEAKLLGNPLAQCPEGANKLAPAVAAREDFDNRKMADAKSEISGSIVHAYMDGGMNPYFKNILRQMGPANLSAMTSLTDVPVSRPRAALFDPHAGVLKVTELMARPTQP